MPVISTTITPYMAPAATPPAVGDGVADDTAAIQWAFNQGHPVELIGSFLVTGQITVTLNPSTVPSALTVSGRGHKLSRILLGKSVANGTVGCINVGLNFTPSENCGMDTPVLIEDVAFIPVTPAIPTALWFYGVGFSGAANRCVTLRNVAVTPDVPATNYANTCIHFIDIRNSTIENCRIVGKDSGTVGGWISNGISITASNKGAAGNAPCDITIRDLTAIGFNAAVWVQPSGSTNNAVINDVQGIMVLDSNLLNCNYGFYGDTSDGWGCTYRFSGNVTACAYASVYLHNSKFSTVTDNYLQAIMDGHIGVHMVRDTFSDTMLCVVTGNIIYGPSLAPYPTAKSVVSTVTGGVGHSMIANNISTAHSAVSPNYTVDVSDTAVNNF